MPASPLQKPQPLTLVAFFQGASHSVQRFSVLQTMLDSIGCYELRVTESQIAFRRRKAFAWTWIPARYLRGKTAPLVLSLSQVVLPLTESAKPDNIGPD